MFQAVLAVIAWTGTILQFWITIHNGIDQGKNVLVVGLGLFSYFTVLSNGFVALVLTIPLCCGRSYVARSWGDQVAQGCATTAILFVGLVYHCLLRDIWDPKGLQWIVDKIQHYVVPVGMGLYWIATHEDIKLPRWAPLAWCLYPFFYFAAVATQGRFTGFYPYPFLNVGKIGWEKVLLHGVGLIISFLVLGVLVRLVRGLRMRGS